MLAGGRGSGREQKQHPINPSSLGWRLHPDNCESTAPPRGQMHTVQPSPHPEKWCEPSRPQRPSWLFHSRLSPGRPWRKGSQCEESSQGRRSGQNTKGCAVKTPLPCLGFLGPHPRNRCHTQAVLLGAGPSRPLLGLPLRSPALPRPLGVKGGSVPRPAGVSFLGTSSSLAGTGSRKAFKGDTGGGVQRGPQGDGGGGPGAAAPSELGAEEGP